MNISDIFQPTNAIIEKRSEHMSPCGQYRLVITPYRTKPGCWNYTQGLVYKVGSDIPIAEIQRNYGAFPFLFITHPNGHSYLVGGADYQGQTTIELDTGRRRDQMSSGAEKGFGFCWASIQFHAASSTLVVRGCIWAAPCELRFFDFSDPMSGWPEIEPGDDCTNDDRWPEFQPDGTVKTFQLDHSDSDDESDDDEEVPSEKRPVAATRTFRRDGLKLVLVEEWVSDKEKERRERQAEYERKYEEWKNTFRSTDPLYLAYASLVKDPSFCPESYELIGVTYDGWCPHFKGNERRWGRRIVDRTKDGKQPWTIDLEWGVDTGPIKLVVYKNGKTHSDRFFEHSVEAMHEAFAFAKSLVAVVE